MTKISVGLKSIPVIILVCTQRKKQMNGKYSPTVTAAYRTNQSWHQNYRTDHGSDYDPSGYDSYGYDEDGLDRGGNQEHEYYSNECLYNELKNDWTFDGTKPVLRSVLREQVLSINAAIALLESNNYTVVQNK